MAWSKSHHWIFGNSKISGTNKDVFFGGIEGGGTKFICAVDAEPTTPEETPPRVVDFFKQQEKRLEKLASIHWICRCGPLDPNPASPTYGHILPTAKPNCANANIVGMLRSWFDILIAFDTNVPCLCPCQDDAEDDGKAE